MASATTSSKKLRVLLIPFFATSHIGPFTDLAVRLTTSSSNADVEATVAVTPANLPILHSMLERHGHAAARVKVATYPFPVVDGLPEGVENLAKAVPGDAWRIDIAAHSETLMRPAQETLIRAQSPDAVVTDMHFVWNAVIANELGVPCVKFSIVGAFPALAMRHRASTTTTLRATCVVPGFPGADIRIPKSELPEFLRSHKDKVADDSKAERFVSPAAEGFGLAVNTFSDLEQPYCDMYMCNGYAKRTYFLGPLSLRPSKASTDDAVADDSWCIGWLDSKPNMSVVYLCFGGYAPISDAQLHELALGLEASGKLFMWVVRADREPAGGVGEARWDRGKLITSWSHHTAILRHPAVGAFVTHCGRRACQCSHGPWRDLPLHP